MSHEKSIQEEDLFVCTSDVPTGQSLLRSSDFFEQKLTGGATHDQRGQVHIWYADENPKRMPPHIEKEI
jgi:hypothetical protein